jgi:hypothetical protein
MFKCGVGVVLGRWMTFLTSVLVFFFFLLPPLFSLLQRKKLALMKVFAHGESKFVTSWWAQYLILLRRAYLSYVRNPGNVAARIFLVLVTGLVTGGANYHMDNSADNIVRSVQGWSEEPRDLSALISTSPNVPFLLSPHTQHNTLHSRAGILYFLCVIYVLLPFANLSLFIYDRQFYSKEAAAKLYAPSAYYCAAMTMETTFNCLNVLVSSTIAYFMIDLGTDFGDRGTQYGVYIGIIMLLHTVGNQWVQLCGLAMPNQDVAFALGAAYIVTAQLFSGFLTSADNFSWLGFMQWIDFLKYAWNALIRNEFEILDENMDDRASVLDFLKVNSPQEIYQNALALLGFWAVFNILSYASLRYLHKEKR